MFHPGIQVGLHIVCTVRRQLHRAFRNLKQPFRIEVVPSQPGTSLVISRQWIARIKLFFNAFRSLNSTVPSIRWTRFGAGIGFYNATMISVSVFSLWEEIADNVSRLEELQTSIFLASQTRLFRFIFGMPDKYSRGIGFQERRQVCRHLFSTYCSVLRLQSILYSMHYRFGAVPDGKRLCT